MEKFNYTKPLIVLTTGFLLWIALAMVQDKVYERQQFRQQAEQSVANSWTNSQTLIGPVIIVPYTRTYEKKFWNKELNQYENVTRIQSKNLYILPQDSSFKVSLKSETRLRGIYPVPVYHAKVNIVGQFDTSKFSKLMKDPKVRQKGSAFLSLSVSDSRGIVTLPLITINKSEQKPLSGSQLPFATEGFSTALSKVLMQQKSFNYETNFDLNGMTSIDFLAVAKSQQITLTSDWPHPMFEGSFLPVSKTITSEGYQAEWKTSQYSVDFENLIDNCSTDSCSDIFSKYFGVKQINPVDVYRQSQRAVTYGILFILVTFIAFALVEILKGIRLHPVQYGLAGANLAMFFLLLLAFSEHLGFSLAYLFASIAVISLLYYYLIHSFKQKEIARFVAAGIAILYGILYLIIQSEDHALLAGSLLLFSLLSAVIVSTRNINWHRF